MECIFEFLGELILTPLFYILFEVPITAFRDIIERSELPKRKRGQMYALIALILVLIVVCAIAGGALLGISGNNAQRISGIVLLSFAGVLFVGYVVFAIVCLRIVTKKRRNITLRPPDSSVLGKTVHVVVDRLLGSTHPEYSDIIYQVNYGFIPENIGGDGEAQDAYILGVDTPITEFDGVVTAIIHRLNDKEDKLVVVPDGME
ncbi:MAG: hypothetical protein K2L88_05440, partial [Clostridiales bacterium]|nr:hypothetical protein [Clostridiales bacterium]